MHRDHAGSRILLALAISEGRAFLQGVPMLAELAVWTHALYLPPAIAKLIVPAAARPGTGADPG